MHDSRYWTLLSHLGLPSAPSMASSLPILSWKKGTLTRVHWFDWYQIVFSQEFSRPQRFIPGDAYCFSLILYSVVGRLLLACQVQQVLLVNMTKGRKGEKTSGYDE